MGPREKNFLCGKNFLSVCWCLSLTPHLINLLAAAAWSEPFQLLVYEQILPKPSFTVQEPKFALETILENTLPASASTTGISFRLGYFFAVLIWFFWTQDLYHAPVAFQYACAWGSLTAIPSNEILAFFLAAEGPLSLHLLYTSGCWFCTPACFLS